jgi:hypothetical protein
LVLRRGAGSPRGNDSEMVRCGSKLLGRKSAHSSCTASPLPHLCIMAVFIDTRQFPDTDERQLCLCVTMRDAFSVLVAAGPSGSLRSLRGPEPGGPLCVACSSWLWREVALGGTGCVNIHARSWGRLS